MKLNSDSIRLISELVLLVTRITYCCLNTEVCYLPFEFLFEHGDFCVYFNISEENIADLIVEFYLVDI